MKIAFFGNGNRGATCLKILQEKKIPVGLIVAHPRENDAWYESVEALAKSFEIHTITPNNPNDSNTENILKKLQPDLFILAGYGKIIKQNIIDIPKKMCINLHAGSLPKFRGSSPMNWALINGETSFALSIIKIDAGIDTGDILLERSFEISINDSINRLHAIANEHFPILLLEAINQIKNETYRLKPQDNSHSSYYPLRFPEDGLILWDMLTAEQVHNRIRALTEPYPCAFTFFKGREVKLLSSGLCENDFFGVPGRLYKKSDNGLLICAKDKCLWIKEAILKDTGEPLAQVMNNYQKLATVSGQALSGLAASE